MKKTKNYEMFGKIRGNRPLLEPHVVSLEESILENNLLYANPIIVSENNEIIDGQHRLEVAKRNNLEIYYITVDEDEALRLVRKLNTRQRGWSLMNFIDSNIELGNNDYQILKDFAEKYEIPLTVSADLLQGKSAGAGGKSKHSKNSDGLKEGKFKIKGLSNAIKLADSLTLAKPFVNGVWRDRRFLSALTQAFKVVGTKKMVKKLSVSPLKVVRQTGTKEYLRNLEDIYNFRTREENRVRFF